MTRHSLLIPWSLALTVGLLFLAGRPQALHAQAAGESGSSLVRMSLAPVPFDTGDTLAVYWHEGDSVRVWADSIAPCWYHLADGAGTPQARFEGPLLRDSVRYYASLPGFMPGDSLTASALAECGGGAHFVLTHSAAYIRMDIHPLPGQEATGVELLPLRCGKALLSRPLQPSGAAIRVLQAVAPRDWEPWEALVARVTYRDGSLGTARLDARPLRPGAGVAYRLTPVLESRADVPASLPATVLPGRRQWITPGQYSGITHLSGERYAVVHDKAAGGGIHFFRIGLDKNGNAVVSKTYPAQANNTLPEGLDNEGIVFLPSSQTLLVSAEADASIREYRLDGQPTGRSVSVPEDLLAPQPNAGFEALGYSEATGLLWTVTERNLPDDEEGLLRLQSFDAGTLQPAGRYLYRCSPPQTAPELALQAAAYVWGVPAITALDDGCLLVLEREVYVPAGSVWEKARGAMSRTLLYRVRPQADPAGILGKELLASFTTSALNLANYEGMCLGPVLPDGRRTLLVIADSQGGMNGLTGEYLKVLLLPD